MGGGKELKNCCQLKIAISGGNICPLGGWVHFGKDW